MNRICVLLVMVCAVLAVSVGSQAGTIDELILNHEVSAANFFGTNARSMAMGQTGIATALDGSAMIYNPANLARVRRLEVRGGLSHLRLENTSDYERGRYPGLTSEISRGERDLTKTHLDGLSVAVPAPTYRGSLVIGLGVHRLKSFDRTYRQHLLDIADSENYIDDEIIETESGGILAWSAAAAIEVSPRMAVGAGISLYTGTAKYNSQFTGEERNGDFFEIITEDLNIEADHIGIFGSLGLSYQATPNFTVGAIIETPSFWNIEENSLGVYDTSTSDYYWEVENRTEYNLRHPFSLGLGAGFSHEQLNLALDLKYTDWSQMEYTDEFSEDLNAVIQEYYREIIEVRIGAEYVLPGPGISFRAGYFLDPLPFPSAYIEDDRQYFTFGLGFLIDKVMTLDFAGVIGGHTISYKDPLPYTEEYKTRRVYVTMGYRM